MSKERCTAFKCFSLQISAVNPLLVTDLLLSWFPLPQYLKQANRPLAVVSSFHTAHSHLIFQVSLKNLLSGMAKTLQDMACLTSSLA